MKTQSSVIGSFLSYETLLRRQSVARADAAALVSEDHAINWSELDAMMDRVAWSLQRDDVHKNEIVAIAAGNSISAIITFLGILRAGAVPAPLTASATPETMLLMLSDSGSRMIFLDGDASAKLSTLLPGTVTPIVLDHHNSGGVPFESWIGPPGSKPQPQPIDPADPFNIIYSSGTTGRPKGIIQSHAMRFEYVRRALENGLDTSSVSIASTPLYSNTTLVSLLPTLAAGGKVVLMEKFDAGRFLALSERERVTHAMLVPVQFRRIMEHEDFDRYDLSSYRMKSSTSAPFPQWLKAEVVQRWPGALLDRYGMTEGGGSTTLHAHLFPNKLHTVGQISPGNVIKIIDERGQEVPKGEIGEIVGCSDIMMSGYLDQPEQTRSAEWIDSDGRRFIRHGDIGRFDEDDFLILLDRSKDMIISGGFNIYPIDLENELVKHPAVREAAVIGVPSDRWGETPFAVIVLCEGHHVDPQDILTDANRRLGKTQRISGIIVLDELPRNALGKILKRELRDRFSKPW